MTKVFNRAYEIFQDQAEKEKAGALEDLHGTMPPERDVAWA
jgi:hypothetical protein